jgi:hypothetical protein
MYFFNLLFGVKAAGRCFFWPHYPKRQHKSPEIFVILQDLKFLKGEK